MAKSIDASPPPCNHIETLKQVGYSFNSAVGDIVDNSITANATEINILFLPAEGRAKFALIDNGAGMAADSLQENMVIGCKGPDTERGEGDLGRFGSGLKTASFSQAKVLTVATKTTSNIDINACRWDTELVKQSNKWLLEVLDLEEVYEIPYVKILEGYESGTVVLWEELTCIEDNISAKPVSEQVAILCEQLHDYIGLYFHRFLKGRNKLTIKINQKPVGEIDPFMRDIRGYQEGPSTSLRSRNGTVDIHAHVLPRFNQMTSEELAKYGGNKQITRKQGLYIYRDRRLIVEGGWYGLSTIKEISNLARIQIDVPSAMDREWDTDLKKSSLKLPAKVRGVLRKVIGSPIRRAENVHKYAGKKDSENDLWLVNENDITQTISYEIDVNNPVLQEILSPLEKNGRNRLLGYLAKVSQKLPVNHIYYSMSRSPKNVNQKPIDDELKKLEELFSE